MSQLKDTLKEAALRTSAYSVTNLYDMQVWWTLTLRGLSVAARAPVGDGTFMQTSHGVAWDELERTKRDPLKHAEEDVIARLLGKPFRYPDT